MKKLYLLTLLILGALPIMAQEDKKFNFYGFVRTDFFYDSRSSVASCNELFYLYPLAEELDANGNDLNDKSTMGFFSFVTRLGVDVTGQKIGNALASAKVEVDFGGFSSSYTLLRIRQAYLNLAWQEGKHSLLVGQTWHPLFGSVSPTVANLATGSPFQPFSRTPQFRYTYKNGGFNVLFAALSQFQYTSSGVNGSSMEYFANGCVPELYLGVDYTSGGFLVGAGLDLLTISPRTEYTDDAGDTYKVNEIMSALSGEVHLKYHNKKLNIAAKSLLASALDHTLLLGGYGVSSVSSTGEQEYTPLHHSTTWLNITYGTKWRPSLFVGYTKNLGSSEELISTSKIYGRGVNIDQLLGVNLGVTYILPNFTVGVEYSSTTAWYGDINLKSGRVEDTQDYTNNRVVGVVTYFF
ncbi:MAG: hypothetical protein SNG27_06590 [Rikenellaceae bacterium]